MSSREWILFFFLRITAGFFFYFAYAEDVSIDVGMGNCEYEGMVNKDLDVNCGMGNVFFEIAGKKVDINE